MDSPAAAAIGLVGGQIPGRHPAGLAVQDDLFAALPGPAGDQHPLPRVQFTELDRVGAGGAPHVEHLGRPQLGVGGGHRRLGRGRFDPQLTAAFDQRLALLEIGGPAAHQRPVGEAGRVHGRSRGVPAAGPGDPGAPVDHRQPGTDLGGRLRGGAGAGLLTGQRADGDRRQGDENGEWGGDQGRYRDLPAGRGFPLVAAMSHSADPLLEGQGRS